MPAPGDLDIVVTQREYTRWVKETAEMAVQEAARDVDRGEDADDALHSQLSSAADVASRPWHDIRSIIMFTDNLEARDDELGSNWIAELPEGDQHTIDVLRLIAQSAFLEDVREQL